MSITAFLVYTLIAISSILVYIIWRHKNYWKDRGIPHDDPSLLMGNYQGLMSTRSFADVAKSTYLKFKGTGPFCGFYFFNRPAVMLLDKTLIKNVLIKDFTNFVDRGMYHNEKDDPLTGHLFLLDGDKWRILRSKLSPTFTSGKMRLMFPSVVQVAHQFIEVFGEMLDRSSTVEIKELLARFSTDVIGTCAFGIECNSLKDPNAEFRVMGRRVFTEERHGRLVLGLIQGFPQLARMLKTRIVPDDVHNFFMRIVREAVDYRVKNNIHRGDFLSILIDLSKGKVSAGQDGAELKGLTVEEMAAQVFVFFLAGFETSSTTMGFALYELAQNEYVQERLRREVLDTFESHNQEFTYECMSQLNYMEQVIAETLRKYTIVPHLNRQALKDYPVPGHPGYMIPKGVPVIIPATGIHYDPDIYPNPDEFDPDRFTPEKVAARETVEWLPFGDGPRNCIGLRFGQMQMRTGLAFLLKNFKFSVCPETEIPLQMNVKSFVTNSKNGIQLKVERIS